MVWTILILQANYCATRWQPLMSTKVLVGCVLTMCWIHALCFGFCVSLLVCDYYMLYVSSEVPHLVLQIILFFKILWLQRHQCPLLNTIPQAVWNRVRVILLQFLLTVLTFCAWLMFLLVSYWLRSDAAITEVTEVHYVNHTVQLPDSTAPSVSKKIILRPSPPFLSYCALEQKWTYSFQNF